MAPKAKKPKRTRPPEAVEVPEEKRKVGRPSSYLPEFCELLIHHMGVDGLSYQGFAGKIGVAVDTLYEWEKVHPEFSDAKKLALAASNHFWDRIGLGIAVGKLPSTGQATYIFTRKNMHRWTDRQQIEQHTTGSVEVKHDVKAEERDRMKLLMADPQGRALLEQLAKIEENGPKLEG